MPLLRIELKTYRLQSGCSTTELKRLVPLVALLRELKRLVPLVALLRELKRLVPLRAIASSGNRTRVKGLENPYSTTELSTQ